MNFNYTLVVYCILVWGYWMREWWMCVFGGGMEWFSLPRWQGHITLSDLCTTSVMPASHTVWNDCCSCASIKIHSTQPCLKYGRKTGPSSILWWIWNKFCDFQLFKKLFCLKYFNFDWEVLQIWNKMSTFTLNFLLHVIHFHLNHSYLIRNCKLLHKTRKIVFSRLSFSLGEKVFCTIYSHPPKCRV